MPLMRRIIGATLVGGLALALPLHALQAGDREGARTAMARGLAALDRGDPRTARVELMNALKADPDWADARVAQARVLLMLGDGVGAEAELHRAWALGAWPGRTRHLLAHALLLQGKPAPALREAQAGDILPLQRGYAARIAGRALTALGRLPEADRAFANAQALAPRDGGTWVDTARFRIVSGDRAGALGAADIALGLSPRSPDAVLLRAELVRDQYGLLASLSWFDRALALDPNSVPALTEYAATALDMGQAHRSLVLTRRALALDPGNARAFYLQGLLAARAGNDDLARSLLARTGGALDRSPAMLLLRGVLYLRGGNAGLAADQFGTLSRLQPDNQRARLLLGRAQMDLGHAADAAATLAPLVDRADADSYALTLAARAMERLGNGAAAYALLDRAATPHRSDPAAFSAGDPGPLAAAASGSPNAAVLNVPYIRALLYTGQGAVAVDRAAILLAGNRGAPAAYVVMGDALLGAGRVVDAAQAYERAADLDFSEDTALRLISAWRAAGRRDRAARVLSLYLGQNPNSIAASRIAASAWLDARNWGRAIAILEPLRQRTGGNVTLLMTDLAWAWLGKGDTRRALVYAAKAYRLQPSSPVAADTYGWVMLQTGHREAAVDLLEKAVALAPEHPMLRKHLDKAYAALGARET